MFGARVASKARHSKCLASVTIKPETSCTEPQRFTRQIAGALTTNCAVLKVRGSCDKKVIVVKNCSCFPRVTRRQIVLSKVQTQIVVTFVNRKQTTQ